MLRLAKVRPEQRTTWGCRPWLRRWSEVGRNRGEDVAARARARALLVEGEHASRRQGEYAVRQRRLRARRCDLFATGSLLLLSCLIWIEFVTVSFSNTKQWIARPGLDFAAIKRKGPRLESPSGCVVGPENPSNHGVLGPEKHHVAFKFARGRSVEFAGGRRTYVEPSNIANDGYTKAVDFAARQAAIASADFAGRSSAVA